MSFPFILFAIRAVICCAAALTISHLYPNETVEKVCKVIVLLCCISLLATNQKDYKPAETPKPEPDKPFPVKVDILSPLPETKLMLLVTSESVFDLKIKLFHACPELRNHSVALTYKGYSLSNNDRLRDLFQNKDAAIEVFEVADE